MRRKTLKRQRKQRGGHPDDADNPDNVRKGLDALVTYFLLGITHEYSEYEAPHFIYGEDSRNRLVRAYYEHGGDRDTKNKFDKNIMIAIALLKIYMNEEEPVNPYTDYEYDVIDVNDLRDDRSSTPFGNRIQRQLQNAAQEFSFLWRNKTPTLYLQDLNVASSTYKALTPEKQKLFISDLFDKLLEFAKDMKGKVKVKVKVTNNETYIDIAKRHLLNEPTTLLGHLNTFENALWFIILYIFSVVKFSYKEIDRGFLLRDRIELREKERDKFRKHIIKEAEALLINTDEGKTIINKTATDFLRQKASEQMDWKVQITNKNGGTRKRRMRKRATK